jgi:hypothetical protein
VYEGGPGVVIARNLLANLEIHSYYDDNSLCNPERTAFQSTGVNPANYNRIHVFPNPTTGKVAVSVPQKKEDEILFIEVSDVTGKLILKEKNDKRLNWIDLSIFNSGIYFLKVYGQSFYGTSKIVLQQ